MYSALIARHTGVEEMHARSQAMWTSDIMQGYTANLKASKDGTLRFTGLPDELMHADELRQAVRRYKPDVAIVDVRMPPTHTDEGARAAVEIRAEHDKLSKERRELKQLLKSDDLQWERSYDRVAAYGQSKLANLLFARELNPSAAARLADFALRVTPITTYYMVEKAGRHVGFASIAIDTVPHALQVTEYMVTETATGERQTDQLIVRLSRGLSLRDYQSINALGNDTTRIMGQVIDSTLIVTSPGGPPVTMPFSPPAFPGVLRATVAVLLDELEQMGLRYYDDFFELSGNWPAWVSVLAGSPAGPGRSRPSQPHS